MSRTTATRLLVHRSLLSMPGWWPCRCRRPRKDREASRTGIPLARTACRRLGSPTARSAGEQTPDPPTGCRGKTLAAYLKKMSPARAEAYSEAVSPESAVGAKPVRRLPELVLRFAKIGCHARPFLWPRHRVAASGGRQDAQTTATRQIMEPPRIRCNGGAKRYLCAWTPRS